MQRRRVRFAFHFPKQQIAVKVDNSLSKNPTDTVTMLLAIHRLNVDTLEIILFVKRPEPSSIY